MLDPAIRDWVVFPLMLMVILVGIIRHSITGILKSDKPLEKEELSHKQMLTRAKRLRSNGRFLSETAFQGRKGYYAAKEDGILRREDLPGQANPMASPDKMMGPMKSQVDPLCLPPLNPYFHTLLSIVGVRWGDYRWNNIHDCLQLERVNSDFLASLPG
ncbi:unnamed protein product [Choristocarpus tenellus]